MLRDRIRGSEERETKGSRTKDSIDANPGTPAFMTPPRYLWTPHGKNKTLPYNQTGLQFLPISEFRESIFDFDP